MVTASDLSFDATGRVLPATSTGSKFAQFWCQSEEGILSRQLSYLEATARHLQSTGRRPGSSCDNVAFLERDARNASSSISAYVRVRVTLRAQILTILSPSVMTTNNSAK